jgi:hypothetical protein
VVEGTHLVEPCEVADTITNHFQLVSNNPSPENLPSLSSSEFLSLSPVSVPDIFKASKHLKPSKSVGHDNIPAFVIMDCSDVLVPVLKHIFNLSTIFSYCTEASGPILILNNFFQNVLIYCTLPCFSVP